MRQQWNSKFIFILAAAGSAVGLGNVWKFPYLAGSNGGGAFVLIYLACVFTIGMSAMLAEFVIGRRGSTSTDQAYEKFTNLKIFKYAGHIGALCCFMILGFYIVVGGWTLKYILASFGSIQGSAEYFTNFVSSPVEPMVYTAITLGLSVLAVAYGINKGIGRIVSFFVPSIFVIMIFIVIVALSQPGSMEGVKFYLVPDWSVFSTWQSAAPIIVVALYQAFFSLSLGMTVMLVYASYLSQKESLVKMAISVSVLDTTVAIIAGFMVFPLIFAFGQDPAAGPGLVFIALPALFATFGIFGNIISLFFFLLLFFAAMTSIVSMLEVIFSFLKETWKLNRKTAIIVMSASLFAVNAIASLSFGALSGVKILDLILFDFIDFIAEGILMPLGAFIAVVAIGWFGKENSFKELRLQKDGNLFLFNTWIFICKYIAPVLIFILFIKGIESFGVIPDIPFL